MNKTADVWRHDTCPIGTIANTATTITDIATSTTIYHMSTKVDVTYTNAGVTLYSGFRPAANATESRFEIQTDDATTPDKLDSTHSPTIIGTNIPSMPFVDVINSTELAMMEPTRGMLTSKLMTFLIMICLSAAAITTINSTVRVIMNFKQWTTPFISTTIRSSYTFARLIMILTCMTMSFLKEFFWATITDMPSDIKQPARRARTRRMRAANRLLPRGRRNSRCSRIHVDLCMMADGYDARKFECCQPYHGDKGEIWHAFVRSFFAAMATREVAEESLEDTMNGQDTGGDLWLAE